MGVAPSTFKKVGQNRGCRGALPPRFSTHIIILHNVE